MVVVSTTIVHSVDLTPFGFTQTEGLAYAALLERGPLGGYALAKALSIARANAYQALDGLATKRAVSPTGERPQRYRPLQPSALLALIVERQTAQLDRLELQLGRHEDAGTPGAVAISSRRALEELALRTAARSPGELTCIGPGWLIEALSPAWHKRAADGSPTSLWVVGDVGATKFPVEGRIPEATVERLFGGPAFLLGTDRAVMVARLDRQAASGYWTSEPALVGAVRAALSALAQS